MGRAGTRLFEIDDAVFREARERFLERNGALLLGDRDLLVQVLQGVLADVLAGAVADEEELSRDDSSTAPLGQESLGEDRGQRHRELLADRVLTLRRKGIGDTRDGRRRVGR